jgi:hypothetical protein
MALKLGQLKNLTLKSVWDHEEYDFTPWLAEENHLSALSDAIGIYEHHRQCSACAHHIPAFRRAKACASTIVFFAATETGGPASMRRYSSDSPQKRPCVAE